MGATNAIRPQFKLLHNNAVSTRPYKIPQALQETVKEKLSELLEAKIIQDSSSNYSSPMVVIQKQNKNDVRLCLDLRMINSVAETFDYKLPLISDIINKLSGSKYFAKLDFNNAFHQIIIPEKDRKIFAFCTDFGKYEYTRLPFGFVNSGNIFQSLLDKVLNGLQNQTILAYLDDIIIGAKTYNELQTKLQLVFERLKQFNSTLSPNKCEFFKSSITYLGFNITEEGIKPSETNTSKILAFPRPNTVRKLKRFLGLCNFYRHLIPKYSQLTYNLNLLTRKNQKFQWTEKCENAFTELQQNFFHKPILRQPNFSEPFYLNTDASKIAISAVLMQKFNGKLHPISYFSRNLKDAETKYAAIKSELLAIHQAIKHFHHYLYGRKFYVLWRSRVKINITLTAS